VRAGPPGIGWSRILQWHRRMQMQACMLLCVVVGGRGGPIQPLDQRFQAFSPPILLKFHCAKRRFLITLKCRQMHGVLNVDEIKN
jgi:hypothetical protein